MKLIGWFLRVVGAAIAGLWSVLLAAGGALLRGRRAGRLLGAIAVGALTYTTVNSPGYDAESGDGAMVAMFAVLTVATVLVAVALVRSEHRAEAVDTDRVSGAGSTVAGPR